MNDLEGGNKEDAEVKNEEDNSKNEINRRGFILKYEWVIWWTFSFITLSIVTLDSLRYGIYRTDLTDLYFMVLFGSSIGVIPEFFKLIYGQYPISLMLFSVGKNRNELYIKDSSNIVINYVKEKKENIDDELSYHEIIIEESKQISEKILSRSGAYLLAGCLIAFSGIALFYAPVFPTVIANPEDIKHELLNYIPRAGTLFFIELIAFFFLKQYRIMLAEYRYYEAIKRKRQNEFNRLLIIEKYESTPEVLKIILDKSDVESIGVIASDESTEILETQKIVNSDMDILTKLKDLVGILKK